MAPAANNAGKHNDIPSVHDDSVSIYTSDDMKKKIGHIEYKAFDLFDENGHLRMLKNDTNWMKDYKPMPLEEWLKKYPDGKATQEQIDEINK